MAEPASNPFAAPQTCESAVAVDPNDAESVRRHYLRSEAAIRSIGLLYYLAAFVLCLALPLLLIDSMSPRQSGVDSFTRACFVLCSGGAVLFGFTGRGIRALKPAWRWVVTAFSVVGLLSFPIGTIIHGLILWYLWNAKGKVIFSSEYEEVIFKTPHVKAKTSPLVLGLLLLLAGLIAIHLIAVLFAGVAQRN